METPIRLRIGLHIEQESVLALVQTTLSLAGHHYIPDLGQPHSLRAYLEMVNKHQQHPEWPRYALLILSEVDDVWQDEPKAIKELLDLLSPLPIILLTHTPSTRIKHIAHDSPHISFLSHSPVHVLALLQAIGRLPGASESAIAPPFSRIQQTREENLAQVRAQEQARTDLRFTWLVQRQEWLDQRQEWTDQRRAWLQTRGKEINPQSEWLAEQEDWLEQQQREINLQRLKISDLRRWLIRYQSRLDDRPPFPFQGTQ